MEENTPFSSRKRNRRQPTPNSFDEEAALGYGRNEYDLSPTRLFQTVGNSTLAHSCNNLELSTTVTCTPRQFQSEWRDLQKGTLLSETINNIPTLSDCHKHFQSRHFFVVASGSSGGGYSTKMFVIAQRQSGRQRKGRNTFLSRCLAEILFDSGTYEMNAEVRCTNPNDTRFFVSALGLNNLFGSE